MGKKSLEQIGIGGALIGASLLPVFAGAGVALLGIHLTHAAILAAGILNTAKGISEGASDLLRKRQASLLSNPISSTAALPVVYGVARVGPAWSDVRLHPTDSNLLYVVGAVCVG